MNDDGGWATKKDESSSIDYLESLLSLVVHHIQLKNHLRRNYSSIKMSIAKRNK
jgi:hypothetical protein